MGPDFRNNRLFPFAIFLSLSLHILLIFLPTYLLQDKNLPKKNDQIKIRNISEEKTLSKIIKTIGQKESDKKSIYIEPKKQIKKISKTVQKNIPSQTNQRFLTQRPSPSTKKISFKDLKIKKRPISSFKNVKKEKNKTEKIKKQKQKQKQRFQIATLQQEVLRRLGASSFAQNALVGKGFNMNIEKPKGVKESELNNTEKVYYGFYKRAYQSYINSFITNYNKMSLERPRIQRDMYDRHRLTAKTTYDSKGNIIKIKILQSNSSLNVHQLFELTLKKITKLPNPPKALINENGEFHIYYQLHIN